MSAQRRWQALLASALFFSTTSARAGGEPDYFEFATSTTIDVATPTAAAVAPGQLARIRGEVRTNFDGVNFDATNRYDDGGARTGGLFSFDGTGFRVTKQRRGEVEVVATGEDAPVCRALLVAAPCVVPRILSLAQDRLLSVEEFQRTLSQTTLVLDLPPPPSSVAPPLVSAATQRALGAAACCAIALAAVAAWWRKRRARPLSRIGRAANEARRAVVGSANETALRARIEGLLTQARSLVLAEERATERLARSAIGGHSPERDASTFAAREASERARLHAERDRARRSLEEIEAALRFLALRSVASESTVMQSSVDGALSSLDQELSITEEANAEAAAVLPVEAGYAER